MFERLKKWLAPELYGGYQPRFSEGGTKTPPNQGSGGRKTGDKNSSLSDKERATGAGEPYVSIIKVDLDPNDINNGGFELDWNDKFIINLIKHGYKKKDTDSDSDIVDRWFTQVCRNIALEIYEQEQADPSNRESDMRIIRHRDLGDGYTEVQ